MRPFLERVIGMQISFLGSMAYVESLHSVPRDLKNNNKTRKLRPREAS
jgi:hypothetical protein